MMDIGCIDGLCATECNGMWSIKWVHVSGWVVGWMRMCVCICEKLKECIYNSLFIKYERGVRFIFQSMEQEKKQCNGAGMNGDGWM